MKKVVFLGCENSHSKQFLSYIKEDKKYSDVEVVGCHSNDETAKNNLGNEFSIKAMNSYDEFVDQVDGIIVTARDGKYHLPFVKPYIEKNKNLTAYIDKPITVSEQDAIELVNLAKKNNIKLTGQSSLMLDENIVRLKKLKKEKGCLGGFVRAPISMNNPYGGFYFYSEHLVDMVLTIFGWDVISVIANEYEKEIIVTFKYKDFEVQGIFGKDNYVYCAGLYCEDGSILQEIPVTGGEKCFKDHFDEFYNTLSSDKNDTNYDNFLVSVFVLNAIYRSLSTKKEEKVRSIDR